MIPAGLNPKNVVFQVISTGNVRAELTLFFAYLAYLGVTPSLTMGHSGYMICDRNSGVYQFLEGGNEEYLIQCDQDMIPNPDALRLATHGVDLVGVTYLCHSDAGFRVAAQGFDWACECGDGSCNKCDAKGRVVDEVFPRDPGEPALKEVAWVGTGCYCISRRAIKRMIETYGSVFQFDVDERGLKRSGCDVHLCRQARAAGIPTYLDRSMIFGHSKGGTWAPTRDGVLTRQKWGTFWLGDSVPTKPEEVQDFPEILKMMGQHVEIN